jgi:hypothetical protein
MLTVLLILLVFLVDLVSSATVARALELSAALSATVLEATSLTFSRPMLGRRLTQPLRASKTRLPQRLLRSMPTRRRLWLPLQSPPTMPRRRVEEVIEVKNAAAKEVAAEKEKATAEQKSTETIAAAVSKSASANVASAEGELAAAKSIAEAKTKEAQEELIKAEAETAALADKKKIATDLADKKVADAKDAAKAAFEVKKAVAKGEKDSAEQEAAAAKVDADKEVASAEAEAASTAIKNVGEVETLVSFAHLCGSFSSSAKGLKSKGVATSMPTSSASQIGRRSTRSAVGSPSPPTIPRS